MGLGKWLARKGAVGGTARHVGKAYKKIKAGEPDCDFNDFKQALLSARIVLIRDMGARALLTNIFEEAENCFDLTRAILTVEAGYLENTPSAQREFDVIIIEELIKLGLGEKSVVGKNTNIEPASKQTAVKKYRDLSISMLKIDKHLFSFDKSFFMFVGFIPSFGKLKELLIFKFWFYNFIFRMECGDSDELAVPMLKKLVNGFNQNKKTFIRSMQEATNDNRNYPPEKFSEDFYSRLDEYDQLVNEFDSAEKILNNISKSLGKKIKSNAHASRFIEKCLSSMQSDIKYVVKELRS